MKRTRRPKAAARAVKKALPGADNHAGAWTGGTDLADLKRLIRLVQRTGIGELELSSGGRSIRIAAHAGTAAPLAFAAPVVTATGAPKPEAGAGGAATGAAAPAPTERHVAITSPMVGTFYRAPAPDADPYVEVGDLVEPGQTVCIIEAMKLMNTIESEVRGRVVSIEVDNSQAVEFGQKLFLIDPV